MKWIALVLFIAACHKPSVYDAQGSMKAVEAVGLAADPEIATRLLFKSCAEMRTCADGCEQALTACADAAGDESQRATLLAYCSATGYRARRDRGDKITPSAWIREHTTRFYDEVAPLLDDASRAKFAELRQKAKL